MLLGGEPVTPFFLEGDDVGWEGALGELDSLAVGVALNVGVEGTVQHLHLLVEVTGLLVHAGLDELGGDLVQLIVWDGHIVGRDTVGSLCWQTTLQVELDSGDVVLLTFLDLGGLGFLVGLQKPLEVVVLELTNVLMLELLGNLDGLVPTVQLLVHSHGFFDLVVLDKDGLSLVELFLENSKLSLNTEIFNTFLSNKLVKLSEIVSA